MRAAESRRSLSSTVTPTLFAGRLTPNFDGGVTALGSEVPDREAVVDSESSGGVAGWTDGARHGWRVPDTHPPQSDTLNASTTRERRIPTENRRLVVLPHTGAAAHQVQNEKDPCERQDDDICCGTHRNSSLLG
jgi:hypothetical protein